ncbi:MAG: hypothetical protein JSS99_05840 [Actinobacteria bacterium]|nr:hypothetical protein [Actinomycetota bacterium]
MRRADLEHVIRAAAAVAEDDEIVVIGSQAILGRLPDAPDALLWSQEADVYPRHHPERAEAVDGSLGDGSHLPLSKRRREQIARLLRGIAAA